MQASVTVRFDILLRSAGSADVVLATVTHTFVPHSPPNFDAIRFETDLEGIATGSLHPGDRLVLKFTTVEPDTGGYYVPNGDGVLVNGRTVNLTLP